MDARTLAELRQLAAHAQDIAGRAMDACEELHRRLSVEEDAIAEAQAKVRDLSAQRRHLKDAAS